MVIRGRTRGNGGQLAAYLMDNSENDQAYVFDIRGTSQPDNLRMSLLEMSFTSELTKSQKGLYHAQINPAYGEDKRMTDTDWFRAADILEAELKLTDQKRVIVMHEKNGRQHAHVVWERYDHTSGKMISDSYSRLAQDRARKTMEKEFEQQRTPERNARKIDLKKAITEIWKKTKTGMDFIIQSLEKGYVIATGTQRPYMLVDDTGRSFDLVRQLEKVKTKDVRERLEKEKLPNEKQAIKIIRSKLSEKNVDDIQEKSIDKIAKFQEEQAAKEELKKLYKQKIIDMRDAGFGISNDSREKDKGMGR